MPKFESLLMIGHAHPSLPGHFPGAPVVPGVVVLDAVLALLATRIDGDRDRWQLPQVKFAEPLLPGEVARIALDIDDAAGRARFRVQRGASVIASGSVQWPPP
jgi:3-hydroxyacyl-[acyl-carrier-protein] dehydratase